MPSGTAEITRARDIRSLGFPGPGRRSRGFTLIEAIVALAIVGIALVPIMIFVGQMVAALSRAGDANARHLAQQSVIELLETLNPLDRPSGEDELGDLVIRWESTVLVEPNTASRVGSGLAGFSMGFYNVNVDVERARSGPWFTFDMRKVGYRRISLTSVPGSSQ